MHPEKQALIGQEQTFSIGPVVKKVNVGIQSLLPSFLVCVKSRQSDIKCFSVTAEADGHKAWGTVLGQHSPGQGLSHEQAETNRDYVSRHCGWRKTLLLCWWQQVCLASPPLASGYTPCTAVCQTFSQRNQWKTRQSWMQNTGGHSAPAHRLHWEGKDTQKRSLYSPWLKGLRRIVTIFAWTGDSDVSACSGAVVSDPWLHTAPLNLRRASENGQIILMFGNDHFQSSWWGNYSVSSLFFPLMLPFCVPRRTPFASARVSHQQSRDPNCLWQLSGRVQLQSMPRRPESSKGSLTSFTGKNTHTLHPNTKRIWTQNYTCKAPQIHPCSVAHKHACGTV